MRIFYYSVFLSLIGISRLAFSLPAFPGAEGFGAETVGGRGGKIIEVTNLNDSGAGSFRAALEASGKRIVVFRVAGTIEIKSKIYVKNPFLTVAGQTAPGDGITIKNASSNSKSPLQISTHDVVLRYLRVRPGPSPIDGGNLDATDLGDSAYNVVIDHCSFSWATDEVFTAGGAHDFTIQWSIIAEGLNNSTHPEGAHSKGLHFREGNSNNISAHHNLLAHNYDRNPNINSSGVVDWVNNVVYNASRWTEVKDKFGEPKVNVVGNYYKKGPSSDSKGYEVFYYNSAGRQPKVYVKGNIGFHRQSDNLAENLIVRDDSRWMIVNSRFSVPPVTTVSAAEAYDSVLKNAGAILPVRDAHDAGIVSDVKNGTGAIIDDPSDVGGWLVMASGTSPADNDKDGMPNTWEQQYGFNANADDGALDADKDGYTNVEEYLNGTDPRVAGGDAVNPPPPPPASDEPPTTDEPPVVTNNSDTLTFTPSDDATIKTSKVSNNYGSNALLEVDKSSEKDIVMKFGVSGIGSDKVISAKLRLYNDGSSKAGGDFYAMDNDWSEETVTWKSAPPADPTKIGSLGSVSRGNWYEVDVTSWITGDGEYSLRVKSLSSDGADYRSKEAIGYAPELVITVGQ
jgi:hypothetical protein